QIPALTSRHARRTTALTAQLTDIALFLGGRAGARISGRLAMTTCRDTLLRLIRALPVPSPGLVPRLGVDEFAVRRGRTPPETVLPASPRLASPRTAPPAGRRALASRTRRAPAPGDDGRLAGAGLPTVFPQMG
ncbi:hypothetical protein ACWGLI_17680, partial [Kitasatospora sp. NPDC054769]